MTTRNDLLDTLAKPPPAPSELDELIAKDPLDLSKQDIDSIIAYQRKARAQREAGPVKRSRKAAEAASGIDLVALVKQQSVPVTFKPAAPAPKPGAGFRRF